MSPTISVIVPCYNQGQYLADALDSLLAQTFTQWECIIINDNSQDETEQVACEYANSDSRFKYLKTESIGVSAVRNKGVSVAAGSYILPLDADDKISPTYLEKALKAFSNNPELALVYGEAEYFGEMVGRWDLPYYSYYDLLFINMIYCSAIFKKADFLRIGGYSTEMVDGLEDWDFWIRLLNDRAKVVRLPEVVFFYRIKDVSRSTELLKEGKIERTRKQLLRRNKEIYSDYMYTILEELYTCKNEKAELQRQLKSIKNSRTHKFTYMLQSFMSRLSS